MKIAIDTVVANVRGSYYFGRIYNAYPTSITTLTKREYEMEELVRLVAYLSL